MCYLRSLEREEGIRMQKIVYRMKLKQIVYDCETNGLQQFRVFYFSSVIPVSEQQYKVQSKVNSLT